MRVRFWTPPQDSVTVTSAMVTKPAENLRTQGTEAVVTSNLPPPTTAPPTIVEPAATGPRAALRGGDARL